MKFNHGFTLIELVITVAIIGILSAIAYPSYTQYVIRTNQAQAKANLVEDAHFLARYYAEKGTYASATLPITQSPSAGTSLFNVAASGVLSADSYVLVATPASGVSQAGTELVSIDQDGNVRYCLVSSQGSCHQ